MGNSQNQISYPPPSASEAFPERQGTSWLDYFLSQVGDHPGNMSRKQPEILRFLPLLISVSPPHASLPRTGFQWNNIVSLDSVLMNKGFEVVSKLKDNNAVLLDEILDSENLTDLRRRHLAVQRKLRGNCGILPISYTHTDELEKVCELPRAGSALSEVWDGRLKDENVAIKVLRLHTVADPLRLQKRICKEAVIWKRLSHPNILLFIDSAHSPFFFLVSPWMDHRDINDYLKLSSRSNRSPLCVVAPVVCATCDRVDRQLDAGSNPTMKLPGNRSARRWIRDRF